MMNMDYGVLYTLQLSIEEVAIQDRTLHNLTIELLYMQHIYKIPPFFYHCDLLPLLVIIDEFGFWPLGFCRHFSFQVKKLKSKKELCTIQ
jgi:hypothetical protein